MADVVKPLKIENPATGGTQLDLFPTEVNPAQDYITAKGFSLEATQNRLIDMDTSGNIKFTDVGNTNVTVTQLRTAANNTFNNTSNGFTATNVQAAIEEAKNFAVITTPFLSSLTTVSTSSTTFTTVPTTTVTPAAGTYIALYSTVARTSGSSLTGELVLAKNTTQIDDTLRQVGCNIALLGLITVSVNTVTVPAAVATKVSCNGTDTISVQFRSVTGGTFTLDDRSIILIRVGPP